MNLIVMGAPGAGKGTQAEHLSGTLQIPAISTGHIIRKAIKDGTKMGQEAKGYIDEGHLVPDNVVIDIVKERLAEQDCQKGFILDGFPRTIPQAEALEEMDREIHRVIDLEVADKDIMRRLSGRRICSKCGASYHLEYKPPAKADICNKCGGALVMRDDDQPDTVRERLEVYHVQTEPLKDFYRQRGKLHTVQGAEDLEETKARTLAALED